MADTELTSLGHKRRRRWDAAENSDRILASAVKLLRVEPDAGVSEIALAAGVSRATVYRHYSTRAALVTAARLRGQEATDANEFDELRSAGELASSGPTPMDVAEVLNKVPPHLLGDQIVAEAQRLAGVTSVAMYLVDIDGSLLLRLAGSEEFPAEIAVPLGVGPEVPREGLRALREVIERDLPGSVLAPMLLRGRAVGALLAVDAPEQPLLELARQAAAATALAGSYTDVFDATRRRKETTAAAEIQQNLLPPRIARISGGVLSGNVLPGYEIGGDWFDYIENRDGAWLGVADSMGKGTTAAALGTIALGAFRAKRRMNARLEDTVLAMHLTIHDVAVNDAFVNAIIGRWHGPSATFRWIACGGQQPMLVLGSGELVQLQGAEHDALGLGARDRSFTVDRRRIEPDERLLLISDGVLDRHTAEGRRLGLDGVRAAVAQARGASAAQTVHALERSIHAVSSDPLEDDATVVVFAPTSPDLSNI